MDQISWARAMAACMYALPLRQQEAVDAACCRADAATPLHLLAARKFYLRLGLLRCAISLQTAREGFAQGRHEPASLRIGCVPAKP